MLEIVYHGPAPPSEVRRVMTYFDSNSDGKVTWKEFKDNLKRLQGKCLPPHQLAGRTSPPSSWPLLLVFIVLTEEGKPSFKESKEHERASDLHETIRKHESKDPSEKLAIPLTTQQDIGMACHAPFTNGLKPSHLLCNMCSCRLGKAAEGPSRPLQAQNCKL